MSIGRVQGLRSGRTDLEKSPQSGHFSRLVSKIQDLWGKFINMGMSQKTLKTPHYESLRDVMKSKHPRHLNVIKSKLQSIMRRFTRNVRP